MRKTQALVNKPVYLGLLILERSKIVFFEFWYDYVKLKYQKSEIMLYGYIMDICYVICFITYLKAEDIYKDIAKDVEKRSETSNYGLEMLLPNKKTKRIIDVMRDELGKKNHESIFLIKSKNR